MSEGRTRKIAACALVGAAVFVAGSADRVARAESCQPSRLLVILDKSSSMLGEITEGQSKWAAAVSALDQVTGAYQETMQIGLSTFPAEGQCSPGQVDVSPEFGSSNSIVEALVDPPPEGGNWTPMAETLEAALGFEVLNEADVPSYVVLITDGWQWCAPYDIATRFAPVDAVERLTQAGITTFVVGFGEGVDPATLNQMAVMAGTERPDCDPTGASVDSPDPCYFQADSPNQLIEALTTVAQLVPEEEICDDEDNNCNGEVDEELEQSCANECGQGYQVCSSGAWSECVVPDPEPRDLRRRGQQLRRHRRRRAHGWDRPVRTRRHLSGWRLRSGGHRKPGRLRLQARCRKRQQVDSRRPGAASVCAVLVDAPSSASLITRLRRGAPALPAADSAGQPARCAVRSIGPQMPAESSDHPRWSPSAAHA